MMPVSIPMLLTYPIDRTSTERSVISLRPEELGSGKVDSDAAADLSDRRDQHCTGRCIPVEFGSASDSVDPDTVDPSGPELYGALYPCGAWLW